MRMGSAATSPTKDSKTSIPAKKPKETISYWNVIVEVLACPIAQVEAYIKKNKVKAHIVRRAAKELMTSHPEKGELFAAWVKQRYPAGRGKVAPVVGDVRDYKAQQVKQKKGKGKGKLGPPFLRLPLDSLGVKKKGQVQVFFEDGEIRVRKKLAKE